MTGLPVRHDVVAVVVVVGGGGVFVFVFLGEESRRLLHRHPFVPARVPCVWGRGRRRATSVQNDRVCVLGNEWGIRTLPGGGA